MPVQVLRESKLQGVHSPTARWHHLPRPPPRCSLHCVWRTKQVTHACCLLLVVMVVMVLCQGAGTIAWLLQELYPGRQVHGWELDPAVVAVAQQHMGLTQLQDSGTLVSQHPESLVPQMWCQVTCCLCMKCHCA